MLAQWAAASAHRYVCAQPFYAVKCHPNPRVIAELAALGSGFDCASRAELELVLGLGVPASRVIFAHCVKSPAHVRWAASAGVRLTTFDNACELSKLAQWHPDAGEILLCFIAAFRKMKPVSNHVFARCRSGASYPGG